MIGFKFRHYTERRFRGIEAAGLKMLINVQARPGVERGIGLLLRCERRRFPVGKALLLRDALTEHYCINFLKRTVRNVESLYVALQFHKTFWFDRFRATHHIEIIANGKPYFGYARIFKKFAQWGWNAKLVKAYEVVVRVCRQLHKGHLVEAAFLERRLSLRVKPHESMLSEIGQGFVEKTIYCTSSTAPAECAVNAGARALCTVARPAEKMPDRPAVQS